MIYISNPPPVTPPTTPDRKVQESDRIANTKAVGDAPKIPVTDRRQQKDRRRRQRKGEFPELRSGKDRRRSNNSSKGARIDIKA